MGHREGWVEELGRVTPSPHPPPPRPDIGAKKGGHSAALNSEEGLVRRPIDAGAKNGGNRGNLNQDHEISDETR